MQECLNTEIKRLLLIALERKIELESNNLKRMKDWLNEAGDEPNSHVELYRDTIGLSKKVIARDTELLNHIKQLKECQ